MTLSTGSYINFGSVDTANGYGIRDNGGQLQIKNSTGNWQSISTIQNNYISFPDTTTGLYPTDPSTGFGIRANSGVL